jgi:hypothetical protein
MPIEVVGPDWPSIRALRAALAEVPENGSIAWANGHSNKLEQLKLMAVAGIETPEFSENFQFVFGKCQPQAMEAIQPEVWLGRRFHHKEGKDILFPDRRFWRIRDYWTKFVPSTEEWRIHVFDGRSIARSKKIADAEPEKPTVHAQEIRNWRNGWRFRHRHEPPRGMRDFAKAMVKACGYLYGACDILVKPDGGYCALEVNTSPAMDGYTLWAYVRAIRGKFATATQ